MVEQPAALGGPMGMPRCTGSTPFERGISVGTRRMEPSGGDESELVASSFRTGFSEAPLGRVNRPGHPASSARRHAQSAEEFLMRAKTLGGSSSPARPKL